MSATTPSKPKSPEWSLRRARPTDNAALCELMGRIPLGGRPRIVQERDDFFALPALHGGKSDTYVVEDATGRIVGCGTQVVRDAWLDGKRVRLGHVGDLRMEPAYRGGRVIPSLARFGLGEGQKRHGVAFSTMATMRSNRRAHRAAASKDPKRAAQPYAAPVASYDMLTVPAQAAPMPPSVERAGPDDVEEIAQFLADGQRQRPFGWVIDAKVLRRRLATWPGLAIEDFLVVRDHGRIVGCAAPWDPSPVRRARIQAWGPALAAYRLLHQGTRPLHGRVPLPAAGDVLRTEYLTHLEVEDDDPGILRRLVLAALHGRKQGTHAVATIALPEWQTRTALRGLGVHRLPCRLLGVSPQGPESLPTVAATRRIGLELALA